MSNRVWILGAPDPEMAAIEQLLVECGEHVVHATKSGNRVHPGNAYSHDPVDLDGICSRDGLTVVAVECAGLHLFCCDYLDHAYQPDVRIDHHRPGDLGYGWPSEEFLQASSIGQTLAFLAGIHVLPHGRFGVGHSDEMLPAGEWDTAEVPPELSFGEGFCRNVPDMYVMVAAADHCLPAAYAGRCPGVDPDALMQWRVSSRAQFQGRTEADVLADIEAARAILRDAIAIQRSDEHPEGQANFPGAVVADLRGRNIPELPEAASREGIPFMSSVTDRDGRNKVVLMAADAILVSRFLAGDILPGLVDRYGDPARGFAGGYLA